MKVCNNKTQIVIVNDNATIHRTKLVADICDKCNINLLFTVPYSPQTNLVAENYFCQLKIVAATKFHSTRNEDNHDQSPIQHSWRPYKQFIIHQWDEYTKENYDYRSSTKIFGCWISVLNACMEGIPLNGNRVPSSPLDFRPNELYSTIGSFSKNRE